MDYYLWKKRRQVYVATKAELLNFHYYARLWISVKNLNIPRRDWLDELANAFRDADEEVEILYRSGFQYSLPEIDDVFTDPDMRWMSGFLEPHPREMRPARQCRSFKKLRILDLYMKVKHPALAEHFAK